MIEFINNIYELSSRIRTSNCIHARKKLYAGCKRRPNSLKRDLRETVSICVKTGVIHRATLSCTSDAQDNNSFFFINFARSPAKERRKFDLFSTLIIFISHNYEKETRSLLGSNILFFFFFFTIYEFSYEILLLREKNNNNSLFQRVQDYSLFTLPSSLCINIIFNIVHNFHITSGKRMEMMAKR